jgi:hypothetical protein
MSVHAAHVDAAVLVEAAVFGRDDRVLQPRRDLVRLDDDPRLFAAEDREDGLVVRGVHVGVRLRALRLRVELRDLRGDSRQQPKRERRCPQEAEYGEEGEEPELADPPTLGSARVSPEGRQNRGSVAPP